MLLHDESDFTGSLDTAMYHMPCLSTHICTLPLFMPPSCLHCVHSFMFYGLGETETENILLLDKPKHSSTSLFRVLILLIFPSLSLLPSFPSSISVRQEGMWHTGLKLDLLTACFYLLNRTDCLPTMRHTLTAPLHCSLQRAFIQSWKSPYCFLLLLCVCFL